MVKNIKESHSKRKLEKNIKDTEKRAELLKAEQEQIACPVVCSSFNLYHVCCSEETLQMRLLPGQLFFADARRREYFAGLGALSKQNVQRRRF